MISQTHVLERLSNQLKKTRGAIPVRLELWDGRAIDLASTPAVTVRATSPAALKYLVRPNMASLGEAYVEGHVDLDGNLADILKVVEDLARGAGGRVADWRRWSALLGHSRWLDRKAIAFHYDVSDDFYQLWLDRNMVYSCAYFKTGDEDIHTAQEQKLDHICRKLRLQAGERFLDIGCGWGALILWAAQHYGVNATGVTISQNQYAMAQQRIEQAGLNGRCRVELRDYRDIPGAEEYDKIASVGMVEHVGHKNMNAYFNTIYRLLKPGGLVMTHGITTVDPDARWTDLGSARFIQRYVFPHGEIPHLSFMLRKMSEQNIDVADVESLRYHYAMTLRHWSDRLEQQQQRAMELIGAKKLRIYRVYLAGCAHGFEQGWVNVQQILGYKDHADKRNPLPWTRAHVYGDR